LDIIHIEVLEYKESNRIAFQIYSEISEKTRNLESDEYFFRVLTQNYSIEKKEE